MQNYMQILHHLYIRDLSIQDFGTQEESWNQPPQVPKDDYIYKL